MISIIIAHILFSSLCCYCMKIHFYKNKSIEITDVNHYRARALVTLFSLVFNSSNQNLFSFSNDATVNVTQYDTFVETSSAWYMSAYSSQRPEFRRYCGPDHTSVRWIDVGINDYEEEVNKIIASSKVSPHIRKVAWFGNIYSPSRRRPESTTRRLLTKLSKRYPHLFNFRHTCSHPNRTCGHIPLPEMVASYSYLLDIGGNGYSGRLKYLLFSHRPLFLVDREYLEYFNEDLIPYHHYIPVNQNLSNLVNQTLWAHRHPAKANNIAANAFKYATTNLTTAKFITRAREVFQNILNEMHY